MPISLKGTVGGGEFSPTFINPTQSVPTGSTGTIITITPPTGKRAAVLILGCRLTAQGNLGITVNIAGTPVVTGRLLDVNTVPNGDNNYSVGPNGNVSRLVGKPDQQSQL